MADLQATILTALAILAVSYIVIWRTNPLHRIPTLGGPSAPVLSYLGVVNVMRNGKQIIEEGYLKYRNKAYKIAMFDHWLVIVSGPKMIDELRRRPDDELSFAEGIEETMQMKYTLGRDPMDDPYHIDIIKEKLTRTLPAVLPEVIDELKVATEEHIPTKGDEWVDVNVMNTMQQIVARASNRAFVGLPACRNQEFLDLAIAFTMAIIKDKILINLVPGPLKAFVGYLFSQSRKSIERAVVLLKPVIEERKAILAEHDGDWDEKPNDMLQWILDEAAVRKKGDDDVAERVLLINFAAIHTSTTTITHVIYDLAFRPEYLQPLREEIERIIAEDGWTKAAMGKMWKLDSFIKESMRYNGIGLTAMTRKVLKDVTLNDGTFLPKGSMVVAAAYPTHRDDTNYADADVFDPFRFSRLREKEGEGTKHQFVNTSVEYVSFGHGKHACPGRFFAANELKAMLAYIVLNYDVKMGGDGTRPANIYYATALIPSPHGRVLFRKRASSL